MTDVRLRSRHRTIGLSLAAVGLALPPSASSTASLSTRTQLRPLGEYRSDHGLATATALAPKPLRIHRVAGLMWAPMLAMGAMLVYAGLLLSLAAACNVASDPTLASSQRAWVQGLQFLGEGLLLSGISFLLGTILMAMAIVVIVAGVIGNAVVGASIASGNADVVAQSESWAIWLEGVRRIGVALYLVAIALGLATIVEVLRFQAIRLRELPAEPVS